MALKVSYQPKPFVLILCAVVSLLCILLNDFTLTQLVFKVIAIILFLACCCKSYWLRR